MSTTYQPRRAVRKRRDYTAMVFLLAMLIALPLVGYVGYLFVSGDKDKLSELGIQTIGKAPPPAKAPASPAASSLPSLPPDGTSPTLNNPLVKTPAAVVKSEASKPPKPVEVKPEDVSPPRKIDSVTTVAQAVEQIAFNVQEALEIPRKSLIVWLFDDSNSNSDYRRQVAGQMSRMYNSLKLPKVEPGKIDDALLLTVIGSYGEELPRFITPEPTADLSEITAAMSNLGDGSSNQEKTFAAVQDTVDKFLPYRLQKGRQIFVVVVSDEVGDDQDSIDNMLPKLKQYSIPVYVVGVQAPFGSTGKKPSQSGGMLGNADPSTPLKGDRDVVFGPESREVEWVNIRYPNSGREVDFDGFDLGPYSLTRLCKETSGMYFALPTRKVSRDFGEGQVAKMEGRPQAGGGARAEEKKFNYFDALAGAKKEGDAPPALAETVKAEVQAVDFSATAPKSPSAFRAYAPTYLSVADYRKLTDPSTGNKAFLALLEAARKTADAPVEVLPQNIDTYFSLANEAQRVRDLIAGQKPAALVQPMIEEIYNTLKKGEKDFDKLTDARLKAGYDLAMGRIMAVKARTDGYMFMLAALRNGKQAETLAPANEPIKNSAVDKMAQQAKERLDRVIKEHPGTPWAKSAERELQAPIGWKFTDEKKT